jgi:hypothetical protein
MDVFSVFPLKSELKVGVAVGSGAGSAVLVGVGAAVAVGVGVGAGVAVAVGVGVAVAVGVGVAVAVGVGVAVAVAAGAAGLGCPLAGAAGPPGPPGLSWVTAAGRSEIDPPAAHISPAAATAVAASNLVFIRISPPRNTITGQGLDPLC